MIIHTPPPTGVTRPARLHLIKYFDGVRFWAACRVFANWYFVGFTA